MENPIKMHDLGGTTVFKIGNIQIGGAQTWISIRYMISME